MEGKLFLGYGAWDRDARQAAASTECAVSDLGYGVRDRDAH
jgi:hypothetical protein